MTIITGALFALLAAVLWRLGGGGFTSLTGLSFGTDAARAIRAAIGLIFCLPYGWYGLVAVPALFLGVCIAGWAPFQGMGQLPASAPEQSWKRWLPELLGLPVSTLAHDFIGMSECGVICMVPVATVLAILAGPPLAAIILASGLLFAPAYLLARLPWPTIPRFATGQEWGEVFTGAMLGATFAAVVHFL